MPDYLVKQGDCMTSIAFEYGFLETTIWNHPQNSELKRKRKDRNILYPEDVVYIPDKQEKQESRVTEKRHRFRRKGLPAKLKIRLLRNEKPRANEKYLLEIDGKVFSGQTDAKGWIKQPIPPNATGGKLILNNGDEEYPLALGSIDPIDEITGVQGRLQNLGFYSGEVDGEMDPDTEAAIKNFQAAKGLPATGEPDQQTKDALKNDYGS